MIFRRNRTEGPTPDREDVPRGRRTEGSSRAPAGGADNPLARRFIEGDEPETIDLQDAPGFPSAAEPAQEPPTETVAENDAGPAGAAIPAGHHPLITFDPKSGTFHLRPAPDGTETLVGGERVSAPTELHSGDRIRIGDAEFEFLAGDS
ncbi:MAG: FHA domain-containing protein [Lysobacterales bacterium]